MTDASLYAYLTAHPMFKGMSQEHLELIAGLSSIGHFSPQQRVFKYDTNADSFFIVREGKVGVEVPAVSGEPLRIQTVTDGAVMGWSWLIPPYRWLFDARVLAPSVIITINGVKLRERCDEDPKLGYELMRRFATLMAERLNAARQSAIKHYTGA